MRCRSRRICARASPPRVASGTLREGKNAPFRPSQDEFHTEVSQGDGNIFDAFRIPLWNFFCKGTFCLLTDAQQFRVHVLVAREDGAPHRHFEKGGKGSAIGGKMGTKWDGRGGGKIVRRPGRHPFGLRWCGRHSRFPSTGARAIFRGKCTPNPTSITVPPHA